VLRLSTVFERYGHQQGALRGPNPRKHGRPSHHPLVAVLAEAHFLLHGWLRSGNCSAARARGGGVFEGTLALLPEKHALLQYVWSCLPDRSVATMQVFALRLVHEPVFTDVGEREHLRSGAVTVATAEEIQQLFLRYQAEGVRFHQTLKKEPWGATTRCRARNDKVGDRGFC
jgi:hypothetical protein